MKELDRALLLNHPVLWTRRIHYVVLYSVLINLLTALLVWLYPLRLPDIDTVQSLGAVLLIWSVMVFMVWHGGPASFSVEKQFGHTSSRLALGRWAVDCACIVLILSPPLVFAHSTARFFESRVTSGELKADRDRVIAYEDRRPVYLPPGEPLTPQDWKVGGARLDSAMTLIRKYTGPETETMGGPDFVRAMERITAIRSYLGYEDGVSVRETALLGLLYGCALSMIAFVLNYISEQNLGLVLSLLALAGLVAADAIVIAWDIPTRAWAGSAVGIVLLLFAVSWGLVRRGSFVNAAELSVSVLAVGVPVATNIVLLRLLGPHLPNGTRIVVCAVLSLLPLPLCVVLLHRWFLTIIAFPRN